MVVYIYIFEVKIEEVNLCTCLGTKEQGQKLIARAAHYENSNYKQLAVTLLLLTKESSIFPYALHFSGHFGRIDILIVLLEAS